MITRCGQDPGLDRDVRFWKELSRTVIADRVPFSGSLALTHRCNLKCIHCYARGGDDPSAELNTRRWLEIIDDIRDAGCLYLLLTGGEPLFRRDFSEIYSHAKRSGFLTTVFTNGTLVNEEILDLFDEFPPHMVEISLYGSSSAVHDRITGVPGSFEKSRRAIDALLERGINLRLKSVLMTLNNDDFPAIEKMAGDLGLRFRFDPAIFPSLSGDDGPLALRVSPERAVDLEMADPERVRQWREFLCQFDTPGREEGLYNCGSGLNTFHVDPRGWLQPCLMVKNPRYWIADGGFRQGWENAFNEFRKRVPDAGMPCQGCGHKLVCGYCPGFFKMENGSETIPSEYICSIGRLRSRKMNIQIPEDR